MTKKAFLRKLELKLEILDEKEQKKVIKKYEGIIDKRVDAGETEEEIVKSFGDLDDLVKEILSSYNISKNYIDNKSKNKKTDSFEEAINSFISTVVNGVKDFVAKFESKNYHSLFEIILYILLGLFILWVLKIPFTIIEAIGSGIFSIFASPFNSFLSFSWRLILDIIYIVAVIWVIVAIFKNANEKKTVRTEKKVSKTNKKNEEIKETIIKTSNENNNSNISNALSTILKIFIVLFSLPFIFALIGLLVTFGILIALIITGAPLWGPILIIFGLILILGGTTEVIYRVTFKRRGNE